MELEQIIDVIRELEKYVTTNGKRVTEFGFYTRKVSENNYEYYFFYTFDDEREFLKRSDTSDIVGYTDFEICFNNYYYASKKYKVFSYCEMVQHIYTKVNHLLDVVRELKEV